MKKLLTILYGNEDVEQKDLLEGRRVRLPPLILPKKPIIELPLTIRPTVQIRRLQNVEEMIRLRPARKPNVRFPTPACENPAVDILLAEVRKSDVIPSFSPTHPKISNIFLPSTKSLKNSQSTLKTESAIPDYKDIIIKIKDNKKSEPNEEKLLKKMLRESQFHLNTF